MSATARMALTYQDEGEGDIESSVKLEFTQGDDGMLTVAVETVPTVRPLAMVAMFGLALHAVVHHFDDRGIATPFSDTQAALMNIITETVDCIELQVNLETAEDLLEKLCKRFDQ